MTSELQKKQKNFFIPKLIQIDKKNIFYSKIIITFVIKLD